MGVQVNITLNHYNQNEIFITPCLPSALTTSVPQLKFGSNEPNPRLGLLASNLGLSPTAESNPRTGSLTEAEVLSGRVPGAPTVGAEAAPAVEFQLSKTVLTSMLLMIWLVRVLLIQEKEMN